VVYKQSQRRGADAEKEQPTASATETVDADVCHKRVSRVSLLCSPQKLQDMRRAECWQPPEEERLERLCFDISVDAESETTRLFCLINPPQQTLFCIKAKNGVIV